jgi:hypothetical protein
VTYTVLHIGVDHIEVWDNVSRQESNRPDSDPSTLILPVANPTLFAPGDLVELFIHKLPVHVPTTEDTEIHHVN